MIHKRHFKIIIMQFILCIYKLKSKEFYIKFDEINNWDVIMYEYKLSSDYE